MKDWKGIALHSGFWLLLILYWPLQALQEGLEKLFRGHEI